MCGIGKDMRGGARRTQGCMPARWSQRGIAAYFGSQLRTFITGAIERSAFHVREAALVPTIELMEDR
jgi:hypothetical protein